MVSLAAGELLFSEGDDGDQAYVITDGEIEIVKITGEQEVMLARGARRLGRLRPQGCSAHGRVPR